MKGRETKRDRKKKERGKVVEAKKMWCSLHERKTDMLRSNIRTYEYACVHTQCDDKVICYRYCSTSISLCRPLCSPRSRPLPDYIVNNYREIRVTAECAPQPFPSNAPRRVVNSIIYRITRAARQGFLDSHWNIIPASEYAIKVSQHCRWSNCFMSNWTWEINIHKQK